MGRKYKGNPIPDWLGLAVGAVLVLAALLALVLAAAIALLQRLWG